MKKILIALAFLALQTGCFMNEMVRLTVDFPHGETRLLVISTGEAYLFKNAGPDHQLVIKDTFDIKEVYKGLKDQLQPLTENTKKAGDKNYGMVSIDYGANKRETFIITDGKYALSLFETARKHIVVDKKK